jgi:hypothetical protein
MALGKARRMYEAFRSRSRGTPKLLRRNAWTYRLEVDASCNSLVASNVKTREIWLGIELGMVYERFRSLEVAWQVLDRKNGET